MRVPRGGAAVAVLFGIVAACGGGTSGPATGDVQGLVRDTTSAALEEVTVLLRNAGTLTTVRAVATSAAGAYSFVGVATGSYDVVIQEPPAMQVVGTNLVNVSVTGGGMASANVSMRFLPVSFGTHVQALFTASCASGGCHAGASPQQGMNLSAGQAYTNTVNVASVELAAMDRIEPSEPDSSYLVHKINNTHITAGGSGARMPSGAPQLPLQTRRMVQRWVSEGAQNN